MPETIIYRIPSAIPYAYVEVHVKDISELPDPVMLAAQYAAYYDAYSKEEKAAIQRALQKGPSRAPDAPLAAEQSEVDRVIDETLKAAQMLSEGLGGATEIDDEAEDARTGDEYTQAPPWSKPTADTNPKPWESDGW